MPLRAADFESAASADSATPARRGRCCFVAGSRAQGKLRTLRAIGLCMTDRGVRERGGRSRTCHSPNAVVSVVSTVPKMSSMVWQPPSVLLHRWRRLSKPWTDVVRERPNLGASLGISPPAAAGYNHRMPAVPLRGQPKRCRAALGTALQRAASPKPHREGRGQRPQLQHAGCGRDRCSRRIRGILIRFHVVPSHISVVHLRGAAWATSSPPTFAHGCHPTERTCPLQQATHFSRLERPPSTATIGAPALNSALCVRL